jgi:2-hydroxychromene-2-carboxylate isomerase
MSIQSLLMPVISQHLLSRERLLKARERAERQRTASGARHLVHYFHQVDDPYSALAASNLPRLLARYDIDLDAHVVGPPADNAAPEREKLIAYSRRDAQRLARYYGLSFADPGCQPPAQDVERATAQLVAAAHAGSFVQESGRLSARLWEGTSDGTQAPLAPPASIRQHRTAAEALRSRLGHYLGATFFYAGEWYWGIDRLHHLEQRLQALGARRAGEAGLLFPPARDVQLAAPLAAPAPIDFYFSLRSPYSAIVAQRVFALGRSTGAPVRLRYLLPMVMRGLPVPRAKRSYIAQDAAREAFARGIPFGRLNDPVGRPTERGLALIAFAQAAGKGQDFVTAFMHGVWAQGLDAGSERGLRRIVQAAGLPWDGARQALQDQSWRAVAEANRQEMFALGLWGVPSFRVGEVAVWGQDRLWAIEDALLNNRQDGKAVSA